MAEGGTRGNSQAPGIEAKQVASRCVVSVYKVENKLKGHFFHLQLTQSYTSSVKSKRGKEVLCLVCWI